MRKRLCSGTWINRTVRLGSWSDLKKNFFLLIFYRYTFIIKFSANLVAGKKKNSGNFNYFSKLDDLIKERTLRWRYRKLDLKKLLNYPIPTA